MLPFYEKSIGRDALAGTIVASSVVYLRQSINPLVTSLVFLKKIIYWFHLKNYLLVYLLVSFGFFIRIVDSGAFFFHF